MGLQGELVDSPDSFLGTGVGDEGVVPEQETYSFFMCICFVVLLNSGVEGCSY